MQIQAYAPVHLDAVIQLSLRAWSPVFDSIQKVMDTDVYQTFYPDDWRVSQQNAVRDVCAAKDINVWVAVVRVDGGYYPSHLPFRSGRATFTASSSRNS